MDSLRLTLILIGLVILALIWMLHKPDGQSRKPGATRRDAVRREPKVRTADAEEDDPEDPEPDAPRREPRQTRLPDMGSEAPDWSADSPRKTDATRVRRASSPTVDPVEPEVEDVGRSSRPGGDAAAEDRSADRSAGRAPSGPSRAEERREPRIQADPAPKAVPRDRIEPKWPGDEPDDEGAEARAAGSPRERSAPATAPEASRIVTLYLRARGERPISGLSLLDSAIKAGLRFGEMKIFHRRHQGATKPVFSMANIARPGSFDPSGWNLFETQGVTLFMTLPGPVSGLDAWDAMLATGQRLSELLDADLMDDSQCLLTRQRIAQIREDMREYDRKAGLVQ